MENPVPVDFIRWIILLPLAGAAINFLLGSWIQRKLGKGAIGLVGCGVVLAAFAIVLGFAGPGRWSADWAIGAPWIPHSNAAAALYGAIVLVVAALAAGVALLRTRAQLAAGAAAQAVPPASAAT